MSTNLKNVPNEEKLKVVKDVVVAYINSSVQKEDGKASKQPLKAEDVCKLIKDVYSTVDEIAPLAESKVGLH